MDLGEAVTAAYKNVFNYSGRSTRSEFWWFQLFLVPFSLPIMFDSFYWVLLELPGPGLLLFTIFWLVNTLANIALIVRRLHDQGNSGFWLLVAIVPLIGGLYILYLMLLSGTDGPNRFGDPKADERFEALDLPSDMSGHERLEYLIDDMLDDAALKQFCEAYEKQDFQEGWDRLAAAGVQNGDIYEFIAAIRDDGFVPQKMLDRNAEVS